MSTIKAKIIEDVKTAMREKNKSQLATLRMIQAALKQKEIDERIELDDTQTLAIINKMAKQHRDSIQQFQTAGRDDLVQKETDELAIVSLYLPTALSEAEIHKLIETAISTTGADKMSDMGKLMAALKPDLEGRADMAQVSQLVKQALT